VIPFVAISNRKPRRRECDDVTFQMGAVAKPLQNFDANLVADSPAKSGFGVRLK
jgi:hypothetical protein